MTHDDPSMLFYLVHRVSQISDDRFYKVLRNRDVTPRQVLLLAAVRKHGSPSQTDLCAVTGIDRSTMGDIVGRLVKRGLVSRHRSRSDARVKVVAITDEGRKLLDTAIPVMQTVEQEMTRLHGSKDRSRVVALLKDIVFHYDAIKSL